MEPIIYALPKSDQDINPSELNIYFDTYPSPKLIKYGFNNIGDQLNMVALTSVPYYKAGLEFDFNRQDNNSISVKATKFFNNKNFDQTFAEFWEIFTLFNLLEQGQTIFSPRNSATIKNVTDSYQKLSKNKANNNIFYDILTTAQKTKASLVVHKYSDIDIDENAAVQFIINDLQNLLNSQKNGSNMVLQFFNLQTQISAEIIFLLSMLYVDAYLIKPTIVSDLFDTKYLVLMNLKHTFNLVIPKHPNDVYIASLGLKQIPNQYDTVIQCMNSDIMPKKYKRYNLIKSYLDTKVYEGATYQEFIKSQNENTQKWLETFGDLSKSKSLIDESLKKTEARCDNHSKLIAMLG